MRIVTGVRSGQTFSVEFLCSTPCCTHARMHSLVSARGGLIVVFLIFPVLARRGGLRVAGAGNTDRQIGLMPGETQWPCRTLVATHCLLFINLLFMGKNLCCVRVNFEAVLPENRLHYFPSLDRTVSHSPSCSFSSCQFGPRCPVVAPRALRQVLPHGFHNVKGYITAWFLAHECFRIFLNQSRTCDSK